MIRGLCPLVTVLSLTGPALAQDLPPALQGLLDYHALACQGMGGSLSIGHAAIQTAELNGDSTPDYMLDSSALACSTAPAMFCSDVGCELNVFVNNQQHSLVVLDWSLEEAAGRSTLVVTQSGLLLNKPQDQTSRMTWDNAANALTVVD